MARIQLAAPLRVATRTYSDVERMVIERANRASDYVLMHINPRRISMRYRKVIQRVQTNTRWVFQHWGYEPITVSYDGVTGYMNPARAQEYSQKFMANQLGDFLDKKTGKKRLTPYDTDAYRALLRLRTFYEEPHRYLQGRDLTKLSGESTDSRLQDLKLNLYYRDTMYIGYFTRMEVREEETSPWMWNYSMEFIAYETQPNMTRGQLTKWDRDDLKRAAVEAGIEADAALERASGLARTAPSVRGTWDQMEARWGAAATAEKAYKRDSFTESEELKANLVRRNLLTEESSE